MCLVFGGGLVVGLVCLGFGLWCVGVVWVAVVAFREFVFAAVRERLPISLAREFGEADFQLGLELWVDAVALEVVEVVEAFSGAEFGAAMGLGGMGVGLFNEVFGGFISVSFADEKELGQYLTPPEVVEFMTQLAVDDLSAEEREWLSNPGSAAEFGAVLDPLCGVGSFLADIVRRLHLDLSDEISDHQQWLESMTSEPGNRGIMPTRRAAPGHEEADGRA